MIRQRHSAHAKAMQNGEPMQNLFQQQSQSKLSSELERDADGLEGKAQPELPNVFVTVSVPGASKIQMEVLLRYEGTVKVFRVLQFFKVMPFHLDERKFHLTVLPWGARLFVYYVVVANAFVRCSFLLFWSPRILNPTTPLSIRIIHVAVLVLYIVGAIFSVNVTLYRSEFAFLFNSMAHFKRKFTKLLRQWGLPLTRPNFLQNAGNRSKISHSFSSSR